MQLALLGISVKKQVLTRTFLCATHDQEGLTLVLVLEAGENLWIHADPLPGMIGRTTQMVNRCLKLSPSPTAGVPTGF